MGRPKEVTNEQILLVARRVFFEKGAGASAVDIAKELGVSHTTIFNRFGSKEGLMQASLGPPSTVPWADRLEAGPDESPILDQLVRHAKIMSSHFDELQEGLSLLRASGIAIYGETSSKNGLTAHAVAIRALSGWLKRAQEQKRMAECDSEVLATTILGALHNWAFTSHVCGVSMSESDAGQYVERLIELLWNGIGVASHG
jgi:AcrR family transcriptional regulator